MWARVRENCDWSASLIGVDLASAFMKTYRPEDASRVLKVAAIRQDSITIWKELGAAYRAYRGPEAVIESYTSAIENDPMNMDIVELLMDVYIEMEEVGKAIQLCMQTYHYLVARPYLYELRKKVSSNLSRVATAFDKLGNIDMAALIYTGLCQGNWSSAMSAPWHWTNLVRFYMKHSQYDDARSGIEQGLKRLEDDDNCVTSTFAYLGEAAATIRVYELAIDAFSTAVSEMGRTKTAGMGFGKR